ncbi:L,D-transpeptidase family protein [Vagococcus sp. JNUCC 83]
MKRKSWLLVPLVLVLIIVSIYSYFAIIYQNKFLPNTTIGQIDVSQLSKKEAIKKIEDNVHQDSFVVLDSNKEWKTIPKQQLGITFDVNKTVDSSWSKQNPWLWFMNYINQPKNVPIIMTDYNKEALAKQASDLKTAVTDFNKERTPTKNAMIEMKDGTFQITNEVAGNTIDVDKFISAFESHVKDGESSIELESYVQKPTVLATDSKLKKELDDINKLTEVSATYLINGQEIAIPKETIASWLTTNDKGDVDLKQDLVKEYVTQLGQQYNTSTNPTKFNSTKRGEVSVPAGTYSWTIATDSETEQLTELILSGKGFTKRVPAYQGSTTPETALLSNTYIEVDLQEQHMWYYKDGKVVLDTPIISGKPSTPTPAGVFYVWNKKRDETLRGEDYASPVDYWMPIDWTGVGIHDSPWQNANAYGGTSYTTVGSHGCINTPPDVCAKLFNMIDVGVPVVVF